MGKVIEFAKCSICCKRPAKYLCDMPIGIIKHMHLTKDNSFKEYTITCDKPICEKCAIEVNRGIHFCKRCFEKLKIFRKE